MDSSDTTISNRVKRAVLGAPRDFKDPKLFHRISLIAFLAWVGLGADGLSSSAYGPDESFRALGPHTYLAVGLALATAFTVFVISYAYSRLVEHFPSGGGGYIVASKLLGPKFGVTSGCALLIDYVLTISVSIASGVDQVLSIFPLAYTHLKIPIVASIIGALTLLNLRGVKESVSVLMPIFLLFLLTHAVLIVGGVFTHVADAGRVAGEIHSGFQSGLATLGVAGLLGIFIRAYSMGAGTYTGIEAVSNGIQVMREPKVETAKKTMGYMAISLALVAGGILVCYLLFRVTPVPGKTMNAALLERFSGDWSLGAVPVGQIFIALTLAAEAALLFVGAQAGFIGGPQLMSNMASDSWLPHRFSSLSDRLTMQDGVLLMAGTAVAMLLLTNGDTSRLVLMYSINVFLTFSLSQLGMVRYWIRHRKRYPQWPRHIMIHLIGFALCVAILLVSLFEKFTEGGWITIGITVPLIFLSLLISRHYRKVTSQLARLDEILSDIPTAGGVPPKNVDRRLPTAVLMVNSYSGLGIHSFLSIQRLFPNHFKNYIFVSVSVVDAGVMKGKDDMEAAAQQTRDALRQYVDLAQRLGVAADYRMSVGTEVLDEAEKLSLEIAKEFPRAIFFAGKLVFEQERWYQRILHNETASQFQRRLQFAGLNSMVLPIRVFAAAPGS